MFILVPGCKNRRTSPSFSLRAAGGYVRMGRTCSSGVKHFWRVVAMISGRDNRLIWLLAATAVFVGGHVLPGAAAAADLRLATMPADSLQSARTADFVVAGDRFDTDGYDAIISARLLIVATTHRNQHTSSRSPKHSSRRELDAGHKSVHSRSNRRRFIIGLFKPKKILTCSSGMTLNVRGKCVAQFKSDDDNWW